MSTKKLLGHEIRITNALIIPGFGQHETEAFKAIEAAFRDGGINPVFVGIHWPRTVISGNVVEFEAVYKEFDPESTAIFGFSAGAQVALVVAAKRSPAILMLASMPGWFSEDLPKRSDFHKRMVGKRRVEDYKTLIFADFAKRITSKSYIFVAEKEIRPWPHFWHRANDANAQLEGSHLIKVSGSGHDIGNANYLKAANKVIASLNHL